MLKMKHECYNETKMLPVVMEYNAETTGEKFKDIAEAMGVDTTGMSQ